MKREIDIPGKKLVILYRIIVVIMLLLVALLITGSLYALIRSRDSGPLFRIGGVKDGGRGLAGGNQTVRSNGAVRDGGDIDGDSVYSIFTGIGMLRIQNAGKPQAGQQQAVIIISINFPYKADDRPFTEELAANIGEFRKITANYFANLPMDKLAKLDEEQAKAEILRQYNALLRLGKIETLYFSDLMIVD
jgi:flagellar basal body-associated protein FliL